MMRAITTAVLLAAVGYPATAAGQACHGSPIGRGQIGLEGLVALTDGAAHYGGILTASIAGPLSIRGSYALTGVDGADVRTSNVAGSIAYDFLPRGSSDSICPVVGIGRVWAPALTEADVTTESSAFPLTAGIGLAHTYTLGGTGALVMLYGFPHIVQIRSRITVDEPCTWAIGCPAERFVDITETDETNIGAVLGANIGASAIYIHTAVWLGNAFATIPGSSDNIVVGLGLGIIVP